jgi:methyltransferase family protein
MIKEKELKMKSLYASNTINSPNPLIRFAHRNRLKKSVQFLENSVPCGKILDYGCGRGDFILLLRGKMDYTCYGYEPFMKERIDDVIIYTERNELKRLAPYNAITLFETIEHLTETDLNDFLSFAREVLADSGKILISAPIEIGPALFLKEISRSFFRFRLSEYGIIELICAAVFGIAAKRAENIKTSHKGFDFRRMIKCIEGKGLRTSILGYGPLPMGSWWGNSQVYLYASWANKPLQWTH